MPFPSFWITTSPQRTSIEAPSELFSVFESFDEATNAVLFRVPQSAASVAPDSVTVRVAPEGRSPKSQESSFALLTVQAALSSDHVIPEGSVSVTETSFASPSPLFVTRIVKIAVSPALIVPFPSFWITTSPQRTSMESLSELFSVSFAPSLEAATSAVLSRRPQSSASVVAEMVTVSVAPAVIVPKSQVSTPVSMSQSVAPVPPEIFQVTADGRVSVTDTL